MSFLYPRELENRKGSGRPVVPRIFTLFNKDRRRLNYWLNERSNQYGISGYIENGKYIPEDFQVMEYPTQGYWYQMTPGELYWSVAKKAYGQENLPSALLMMNDNSGNDHIQKKEKNWTSYGVKGLQSGPHYGGIDDPRGPYGSGKKYPIVWIPPLDGGSPEDEWSELPPEPEPEPPFIPVMPEPTQPVQPGPQGPTGPMGPQGPMGPMGPKGATGPAGPKGPKGDPGSASNEAIKQAVILWMNEHKNELKGPPGSPGPSGPKGPAGPAGPSGSIGPQGPIGPVGPTGPEGLPGMIGPMGPTGPIGPMGPTGPIGKQGAKGEKGKPAEGGLFWLLPLMALYASS